MQYKDPHIFNGLNTDDAGERLPEGDYVDMLNMRVGGSSAQHGSGNAESLQSEVEIKINPDSAITYYGESIGGGFIYSGYSEVQIGTQVWMKKNWDADYPGSKVYDDDEDNEAIYGRLYTHNQIMSSDFCPTGWRVPTEADIDLLLSYLGGLMIAGGKLKEVGDSHWTNPNTSAVDSSGFRALPGGKFDDVFSLLGMNGMLWLQNDGVPVAPIADDASDITAVEFVAHWEEVFGVTGYYLDVATDAGFTSMVAGYNNKDVGKVLLSTVSGLSSDTPYYYRVRAYNEIGPSENSNATTATTLWRADDWFLPSKDELNKMYTELKTYGVGGFADSGDYCSSSESGQFLCWRLEPSEVACTEGMKGNGMNVKHVRAFTSTDNYSLRDTGPGRGLVFYKNGNNYLEASVVDLSANQSFSNVLEILGTTDTAIGSGQANTTAIINQVGHVSSAAKLCDDFYIDI